MAPKSVLVFPNKSHDRPVAGWICEHSALQAAKENEEVILCAVCTDAMHAGATIVRASAPARRPHKGRGTKPGSGKRLKIAGAHKAASSKFRKKRPPGRKRGGLKR